MKQEHLPRGYAKIIAQRLEVKGIKVSPSTVYAVANGRSNNALIQNELERLKLETLALENKTFELRKKRIELQKKGINELIP